jgi:hypothetical protein
LPSTVPNSTIGNSAELLLTGTQFMMTFTKYPKRGLVYVQVDDVKIDTIAVSELT